MSGSFLSEKYTQEFFHVLLKCPILSSLGIQKNSDPYTANFWATDYEEDCKAYFCQGNSGKQSRTNIGYPGSLFFRLIEISLMHNRKAGHGEGAMVRVDGKCEAYV